MLKPKKFSLSILPVGNKLFIQKTTFTIYEHRFMKLRNYPQKCIQRLYFS